MLTKQDAKDYLQSIIHLHISANIRKFFVNIYVGEQSVSSLGMCVDLPPATGKVIGMDQDWVAIKTGSNRFFVCAKNLMSIIPGIGDTVTVTPYARRGFDGQRLDAPKSSVNEDGVPMTTYVLGRSTSRLPVEHSIIKSSYLRAMVTQVEESQAPDGIRSLAQVLIDSGALKGHVSYIDPLDSECAEKPPTLQFRIDSKKFNGWLNVIYQRANDCYKLQLIKLETHAVAIEVNNVLFTTLAAQVVDLVDDGSWNIAKVVITKSATKPLKLAA